MNPSYSFIWFVLFASSASGAEYSQDLAKIKKGNEAIQNRLHSLGVPLGMPKTSVGDASDEERSLYKVHDRVSRVRVPLGKLVYGKTLTRWVIAAEGTPALIRLNEGQGWLSEVRILGNVRQGGAPGRAVFDGKELLLNTGRSIAVKSTALDDQGAYGIEAQILSGKMLSFAGAVATGVLSGMAASQQSETVNAYGFSQTERTGRNAVLQGLAQSATDQSKRLIDEATAEKPVLIVEPGTSVSIIFQEELNLP